MKSPHGDMFFRCSHFLGEDGQGLSPSRGGGGLSQASVPKERLFRIGVRLGVSGSQWESIGVQRGSHFYPLKVMNTDEEVMLMFIKDANIGTVTMVGRNA